MREAVRRFGSAEVAQEKGAKNNRARAVVDVG
jgi:hypothetical protein